MVDLNMKWNDYDSDRLYLWNGTDLFIIIEGSGDNLSEEDIEEGYVDYWMTECYTEGRDGCGGQWLETELITNIDYTIQGVIDRMMECDLWDDDWTVIDEDLGLELYEKYEEVWKLDMEINAIKRKINKEE